MQVNLLDELRIFGLREPCTTQWYPSMAGAHSENRTRQYQTPKTKLIQCTIPVRKSSAAVDQSHNLRLYDTMLRRMSLLGTSIANVRASGIQEVKLLSQTESLI